jgi:photosystem II stability/assembly factor-like uncharacterized protein
LGVVAPSASAASIWSPVASGTTSEITGIEYQSDARFWFVTANGEIFTRQPAGTFQRTFGPSSIRLTDITFQKDGGQIGFAVGDAGQVLRSVNGGATWTNVNPGGTPIPASQNDTTFADCTASDPLGNVSSVRFAGNSRVYIMGQGAQFSTSQPATAANVGATGTWTDANRDTHGTPSTADDTCRLQTSYGSGIGDAFFASNPDVFYVCTAFFGELFFTSNNLATTATKKPGSCGNGGDVIRRITGDPANSQRQWAVGPGGAGTSYTAQTQDGWATSDDFKIGNESAHEVGTLYDVSSSGNTVVAVGDGGTILNSGDGNTFFHDPADGANATGSWRATSVASATQAAVGGSGGALLLSTQANATPDLVAPAGSVSGPATGTVGQPVTFTANVADNTGGSGIDPASFAWGGTGFPAATGNPAAITFPAPGFYTVTVTFRDRAGNSATASASIQISAAAPARAPATVTHSVTVPGGTIKLSSPKACVPAGTSFTATLSFKKSTKKGAKKVKVTKVVFSIDGKTVKTDKKAPFKQTLTVRSLLAGSKHKLKARATIKVRHGKSPTKSVSASFGVC